MQRLLITLALSIFAALAHAQSIRGTIQINKKLTRRSVTAAVPLYQRGATVKLPEDAEIDPLAAERSHVIIYLEGSPDPVSVAPARGTFIMKQQDRQFMPDLLVVPLGATVTFPNMDPIFHNVFSLSQPKTFDLGSYDKGDFRNVTFNKSGVVSLYCHLHPNMAAAILVAPNRYYARADRDGHFQIHDVPPGHYTLVAWHKAAGTFRQPVIVRLGEDAFASFVLPYAETAPQMSAGRQLAANTGGVQ